MLKSDHFGIEIYKEMQNIYFQQKLKSDHFGIEINEELERAYERLNG